MKEQKFEIYGTAHSWIKLKDFFKKPKMVLFSTIDLEVKGSDKLILALDKLETKQYFFKYMMISNAVDEIIFKALRKNKSIIKDYDYVVPNHITYFNKSFHITLDCFVEVKK